jgi:peptidoglycan hydrolase CwlO-like protein
METFITFGLGVLITLSVVGVIYSVKTISKIKKDTEESLDEIEDYTTSVSELNDKVESLLKKLEDVDKKHDNVNEGIYRNIEQLDSNQEEIYLRLSEFEDEDEEDTE